MLYLAAALVATGVVFLLLDAPFLFGVQLLLYAGGVVTIVVFAIMLTERLVGQSIRQTSRYLINGAMRERRGLRRRGGLPGAGAADRRRAGVARRRSPSRWAGRSSVPSRSPSSCSACCW